MKMFKKISFLVFSLIIGFISSYYFESFLSMAFNLTKGVSENPEGKIFMPLGVIIILTILTVTFLTIKKVFKSTVYHKTEKFIFMFLLILVWIVGTILTLDYWRNFFVDLNILFNL